MAVLPPNPDVVGVARHLRAQVLPVKTWPKHKELLSQISEDVTEFDDELGQLVMDMILTMDTNNGIGLAAPQVGVLKNVIVLGFKHQYALKNENSPTAPTEYTSPHIKHHVMINPKIKKASDRCFMYEEGCISVPGYFNRGARPYMIQVEYQTPSGKVCEGEFSHLDAFAIQHEIDHLNGKLFIDDLSSLKQQLAKRKVIRTLRQSR